MSPTIVPPYQANHSSFGLAIPSVLRHEGGWVDNPKDPGGETNFGISMLMVRAEGMTPEDLGLPNFEPGCMRLLTVERATELYRRFFWDKHGYGRITNQAIATKIFDTAVNCGPARAHIMAQRVVGVADDGVLGPASIAAINAFPPTQFLSSFCAQQEHYYRAIVATHPSQAVFLANWLKRAADVPQFHS